MEIKVLSIDPGTSMGYCINDECSTINLKELSGWKPRLKKTNDKYKVGERKGQFKYKEEHKIISKELSGVIQPALIKWIKDINPTHIQFEKSGMQKAHNEFFEMLYNSYRVYSYVNNIPVRWVSNITLNKWIEKTYGNTYVKTDKNDAQSVLKYFKELDNVNM